MWMNVKTSSSRVTALGCVWFDKHDGTQIRFLASQTSISEKACGVICGTASEIPK